MTPDAAARIQSAEARASGGGVQKGSFAARAQVMLHCLAHRSQFAVLFMNLSVLWSCELRWGHG